MRKFCIYNITLPGQETNSQTLPSSYIYPNIHQLVSLLLSVTEHYNILTMLGLGVGLGANILLRFALKHQQMVEGLVLINCSAQRQGRIGYSSLALSRSLQDGLSGPFIREPCWYCGLYHDQFHLSLTI